MEQISFPKIDSKKVRGAVLVAVTGILLAGFACVSDEGSLRQEPFCGGVPQEVRAATPLPHDSFDGPDPSGFNYENLDPGEDPDLAYMRRFKVLMLPHTNLCMVRRAEEGIACHQAALRNAGVERFSDLNISGVILTEESSTTDLASILKSANDSGEIEPGDVVSIIDEGCSSNEDGCFEYGGRSYIQIHSFYVVSTNPLRVRQVAEMTKPEVEGPIGIVTRLYSSWDGIVIRR